MPAVWEPNPKGAEQDYTSSGEGGFFSGTGAPTFNAHSGDFYLDTSSGDIYKFDGDSWTVIGTITGGGGAAEIQTGTGSPEGVVIAAVKTLYIDPTNHQIWVKETGSGNTGWVLAITYA